MDEGVTIMNSSAPNHLYKEIDRVSLVLTIVGLTLWTPLFFWIPSSVLEAIFESVFAFAPVFGLGRLLTAIMLSTLSEIGLALAVKNKARKNTKIAFVLGIVGVVLWVMRIISTVLIMVFGM